MQVIETLRQKKTKKIYQHTRNYVNNLYLLVNLYYRPLEKKANTKSQILSKNEIEEIFENLKQITILFAEFLYNIEYLLLTWEKDYKIGEYFLHLKNRMQDLVSFWKSSIFALKKLKELESNQTFSIFTEKIKNNLICEGNSFEEYFLLTQYYPFVLKHYLKKLLLVTDTDHPDHQIMEIFIKDLNLNLSKIYSENYKSKKIEAISHFKNLDLQIENKINLDLDLVQNSKENEIQIDEKENKNDKQKEKKQVINEENKKINENLEENENQNENENKNESENLEENKNQNENQK
ncbi:protein ect2 [Anaeramoeba ignava]|uniref:Protein ect2 n=1 Tax=Anaeramoeba ignava TaxID=1746090 RepID=A0A9Q0LEH6_ANAIG|nr:protein ect2 [Anaeramoeba ignava]